MRARRVAGATEIPLGSLKRVVIDDVAICVVRAADGSLYGIDDACTHEGASLSDGFLEGCEIECPMHSSMFDLRTGRVVGPPAREDARVYRVIESDGALAVEIEEQD